MIGPRIAACVTALLLTGCAVSGAGYRYDRTFDQQFAAQGIKTLEIRTGSGDVHLLPGGTDVNVHGVLRASSLDAVRRISFESRRIGDRLILTVDEETRGITINFNSRYEVKYPLTVALDIHTGSGDIVVQSPRSVASAQTGSGDVKFLNAAGDVNISTASGDVTVNLAPEWAGNLLYIGTASGDQHLALPAHFRGHIITRTSSGSITDKSGARETSAQSGATVSLRSTTGDITITQ